MYIVLLSNMSKHQNHLKALAKDKLLDLTPTISESTGLEGGTKNEHL